MLIKIRFFMRMIWGNHFYGFRVNGIKYHEDQLVHLISIKFKTDQGSIYPLLQETSFRIKNEKSIGVNFLVRKD